MQQSLKNLLLRQNLKLLVQSYLQQLQSCWLPLQMMKLLALKSLLQSRSCLLLKQNLKPLEQNYLPRLQSCWLLLRN